MELSTDWPLTPQMVCHQISHRDQPHLKVIYYWGSEITLTRAPLGLCQSKEWEWVIASCFPRASLRKTLSSHDCSSFLSSPIFLKNFLFYIGVEPINNVVVVSGGQWRNSATHIHVFILPTSFPTRLPHSTEWSSLCYPVTLQAFMYHPFQVFMITHYFAGPLFSFHLVHWVTILIFADPTQMHWNIKKKVLNLVSENSVLTLASWVVLGKIT